MLKRVLLAVLLCLAGPALAQTPPATTPLPRVAMVTSLGRIVLELDTVHAPITARNFLRYVDARRYDGQQIYRAMKTGENIGLIQGGVVTDGRLLYPPIAHEPTSQTGLTHVEGALSAPRGAVGTARADFTIMASPLHYLDAGPEFGQRRRARLCGIRARGRGDGRGPRHPQRADLADRRAGADARADAAAAGPDHQRAAAAPAALGPRYARVRPGRIPRSPRPARAECRRRWRNRRRAA